MPRSVISAFVIRIDAERCKGCQLCLSVCPRKIIGLASSTNEAGYVVAITLDGKASGCTGCLACTDMCPDAAISVYRDDEAIVNTDRSG